MKEKAVTSILLLFLSISADAATIENLIKTHGKEAIMDIIAFKVHKKFTVYVDGKTEEVYLPNTDYVTPTTLAIDIERAGMSVKSVEKIFLERNEEAKAQETRNAEYKRYKEKHDQERQAAFEKWDQEVSKRHTEKFTKRQALEDALTPEQKEARAKKQAYDQMIYEKAFGTPEELAQRKREQNKIEREQQHKIECSSDPSCVWMSSTVIDANYLPD